MDENVKITTDETEIETEADLLQEDGVKAETIIRTICLALTLINQLLIAFGKKPLPIEDDQMYKIVSTLVTAGVTLWCWWKNNSFTLPAIKADKYLEKLRKEEG